MSTRVRVLTAPSADFWSDEGRSTLRIDAEAVIRTCVEHQGHALLVVTEPVRPSGQWRDFRVAQGDPPLAAGESWAGTWSYGQRLWHLIELPRQLPFEPSPPRPDPELIGMPKRKRSA